MSRRASPSSVPPAAPKKGRKGPADSAARVRALAAQLAHDVGKYVARTARNLASDTVVDAELLAMLCRDLYGDAKSERPIARFAALAAELRPLLDDARLTQAERLLAELESREAAVRADHPEVVQQAVALALQIENLLRALATAGPAPSRRQAR